MKKLTIRKDSTDKQINELLRSCSSNTIISFENGEYHLLEPLVFENKDNCVLKLNESVFYPYYDNAVGADIPTKSINVFHISNCNNLEISGGIIRSESPANVRGKIIDVTDEYLEVELYPKEPLTGKEIFVHGRAEDEKGRPCRAIIRDYPPRSKTYSMHKHKRIRIGEQLICSLPPCCPLEMEFIQENVYRIHNYWPNPFVKGMNFSISHIVYGNAAFIFTECTNVIMDGLRIESFGGMAVIIFPNSRDFTFQNIIIRNPDQTHSIEAIQSDGFHIVGCGGKIVFDNCYFDATLDDCVNVHSQLLTVTDAEKNQIDVIFDKPHGIVYKNWSVTDDILRVYDKDSKLFKGTAKVISVSGTKADIETDCEINKGDYIANTSYFCEFEAKNCHLKNCTGGILLRSVNKAHIHDSKFDGVGTSLGLSIGFEVTKEAGLVENVLVEKNEFLNARNDFIIYSGMYPKGDGRMSNLYKNIRIINNLFQDSEADKLIEFRGVDGVLFENNTIINCESTVLDFIGCEHVICRD